MVEKFNQLDSSVNRLVQCRDKLKEKLDQLADWKPISIAVESAPPRVVEHEDEYDREIAEEQGEDDLLGDTQVDDEEQNEDDEELELNEQSSLLEELESLNAN